MAHLVRSIAVLVILLSVTEMSIGVCLNGHLTDQPVVWAEPPALEHRADVLKAAAILREFAARNYTSIQLRCFGFELEDLGNGRYDFALRFNERRCGGHSPSNLLDRHRVVPATRAIFWYDPAEGQFTKKVQ